MHEADPFPAGRQVFHRPGYQEYSDKTFATIVFEAVFSDGEGKVLETVPSQGVGTEAEQQPRCSHQPR
jgi:hypothetical protein